MRSSLYEDVLVGASHWSMLLRRGVALTLTDITGTGNVGMLLYNPVNTLERLNLPDTLKCQHTFKLTAGHCLYSDMGRVFCSIIHDDLGWHDAASGTCNAQLVAKKWGALTYQAARNDAYKNGRDSFLIELAKYGLGRRDLAANVNWFSRVDADDEGYLRLDPAHSKPGAQLTLRFEMDTIVALHTCAHPLSAATQYPRAPIRMQLALAEAVTADDICRTARVENQRGLLNSELYNLGLRETQHV